MGSNGGVVHSSDINNWTTLGSACRGTTETSTPSPAAGHPGGGGQQGHLRYSTNGTTWTTPASISEDISAINLNGVWVAVGNGKINHTSTNVG